MWSSEPGERKIERVCYQKPNIPCLFLTSRTGYHSNFMVGRDENVAVVTQIDDVPGLWSAADIEYASSSGREDTGDDIRLTFASEAKPVMFFYPERIYRHRNASPLTIILVY